MAKQFTLTPTQLDDLKRPDLTVGWGYMPEADIERWDPCRMLGVRPGSELPIHIYEMVRYYLDYDYLSPKERASMESTYPALSHGAERRARQVEERAKK